MDIVEPQKPECRSLIEPTATDIIEHTLHPAGSAQILDCYRNGYRRASEARFRSASRYRKRLPWALWKKPQFLLKLSQWIPSSLRGQNVEVLSNLPQRTSSSLLYTLRAPPKCWIATAMEIVEPQRPNSARHVESKTTAAGALELWSSTSPGREKIIQYINRNMHKLNHNQILAVSR